MARKYPKVSGYWVYSIQIPSVNKYYIGISQMQCCNRWCKSKYKGTVLEPYLDEWDSMIKTVLIDGLTKEESYQYEGKIIEALQNNNLSINEQRSGLFRTNNKNAYTRELLKNNPEYREHQKQYNKQWQKDNKEKIREQRRLRRLKRKQQQSSLPLS